MLSLPAVLAAAAALELPGLAWQCILRSRSSRRLNLIDGVADSIALTALLALLLSLGSFHVGRQLLLGFYAACAAIVFFHAVWGYRQKRKVEPKWERKSPSVPAGEICVLALLFAGVLLLRLVQIRELVLPNWVDSLQHTLIVQLLRDEGALPRALAAFEGAPFYYHFGFHTITAAFAELAGLPDPAAILILGQVLSALIALAVYRLAVALTRQKTLGLSAALATAFISQMPAYYTSWGRYTLLTGMLMLPVLMRHALVLWRNPGDWRQGLRLALLTAGLGVTHYLVAVMYVCFLAPWVALLWLRPTLRNLRRRTVALLGWSAAAGVAAAPWLLRVLRYTYSGAGSGVIVTTAFPRLEQLAGWWQLLDRPRSWLLAALAGLALTGLLRRERRCSTALLSGWLGVMLALFTDWPWQIAPFRFEVLLIVAFLPINVLAAEGLQLALGWLARGLRLRSVLPLWALVWGALVGWGVWDTATIINPQTVLATAADLEALEWIAAHSPAEARFLINIAEWQSGIYRGTDAGWWIPLLSDRETILPPSVQYDRANSDFAIRVRDVAEEALALRDCSADFWDFVARQGVTHIFIGTQGGPLQPRVWDQCVGVRRIYMGADVHIYEIVAPVEFEPE